MRECLEGHRARRPETKVVAPLGGRHCHQQRQRGRGKPPQGSHFGREAAAQIGQRVEIEIEDPDNRKARSRPTQRRARLHRGAGIEIVDQHQRADREQQVQHGVELARKQRQVRSDQRT